jgi:hypothetical protein
MLGSDGYFAQTLDLALVPISKDDSVTPLVLLSLKLEHNIISIGIAYV